MDKNQGNRFGQINGKSKVAVFFVSFRASENARGPDLGHKIPQFIWNTALNGLKMSHFYPLVEFVGVPVKHGDFHSEL